MKAIIWTKLDCTFCIKVKSLLEKHGIEYEERVLGDGWTKEQLLEAVPNAKTVPQVTINGILTKGFTETKAYLEGK